MLSPSPRCFGGPRGLMSHEGERCSERSRVPGLTHRHCLYEQRRDLIGREMHFHTDSVEPDVLAVNITQPLVHTRGSDSVLSN